MSHRSWLFLFMALAVASGVRADEPAAAQESVEDARSSTAPLLPVRISAHASITWEGEFGFGGRVDIRLLDKGLLSTRDELSISVGMDVIYLAFEGTDPLTFWPTGTVQWTLGLTPNFSFYPELGLVAEIDDEGLESVLPNIGFGGRYHVWRSVAVTARLGWPMAISLGACF